VLESAFWAFSGSAAMRADLQAIAATNGVSEEVVNAMRRFPGPDAVAVQRSASGALAALSAGNPSLQASIAASRGIDAILAAMRQHADDVQLQQLACGALSNLAAKNPNNQTTIGTSGGLQIILRTFQRHLESTTVLQSAMAAIWCLVKNNTEHQQRVLQEGGVELMISAIQRHPDDNNLKALARGPLQSLVPGLADVLAAESADAPSSSRTETNAHPPDSSSTSQAFTNLPDAQAGGPQPMNGQHTARRKAEASLPAAGTSSPTRLGWALETIDEGSDSGGGSPGSAASAAQPPGLTARGVRRTSNPLAPPASKNFELDEQGRSKSK